MVLAESEIQALTTKFAQNVEQALRIGKVESVIALGLTQVLRKIAENSLTEEQFARYFHIFGQDHFRSPQIEFLPHATFTEAMVTRTVSSYTENYLFYGSAYEFNDKMRVLTWENYLQPFIESLPPRSLTNSTSTRRTILNFGCGLGSDAFRLTAHNCQVIAVDAAATMISTLQLVNNDKVFALWQDMRDFDLPITADIDQSPQPIHQVDGILVDSAIQHVSHEDVYTMAHTFGRWLPPGAPLLMRLRPHHTGHIFRVLDQVGERFFSTWTRSQIHHLTADISPLFDLEAQWSRPHADQDRPGFEAILLRRKA